MFISMAAADLNLVSVQWEQLAAAQSGSDLILLEIHGKFPQRSETAKLYIFKKREKWLIQWIYVSLNNTKNCESKFFYDFIYMKSSHKLIFLFCLTLKIILPIFLFLFSASFFFTK